ncbi:uncharacterized protein LOC132942692 [Metopolophium dirhodum]|uniref:uncharacterized protein LOC132942692 n=1 Tax=Metopolophium dirhodum TaxID=44670 RepID=UPI00298F9D1D|nr:uncharacterized protein LOC132942692 [Metopolophium dirhodum]
MNTKMFNLNIKNYNNNETVKKCETNLNIKIKIIQKAVDNIIKYNFNTSTAKINDLYNRLNYDLQEKIIANIKEINIQKKNTSLYHFVHTETTITKPPPTTTKISPELFYGLSTFDYFLEQQLTRYGLTNL